MRRSPIIVVATIAVILASCSSSSKPHQSGAGASKYSSGVQVPITSVRSPDFVDPLHGFGVVWVRHQGVIRSQLVVSNDGGRTWRASAQPLPAARYFTDLRFVDLEHGYAVATDSSFPFIVTSNGGVTWHEAPFQTIESQPNDVRPPAFAAYGSLVWALSAGCSAGGTSCQSMLNISSDYGQNWRSEPVPVVVNAAYLGLFLVNNQEGYILEESASAQWVLEATSDAAIGWSGEALPDSGTCPSLAFSAAPGGNLWVICGSGPATDMEAKTVYISTDGGATWHVTGSTGPGGPLGPAATTNQPVALATAPVAPALGNLPFPGTVSNSTMVATSAQHAWVAFDRGAVQETSDAGLTWNLAFEYPNIGEDNLHLDVLDSTHAWAYDNASGIWSTSDGIHWTKL